jgi:hypothetical protein
MNPAIFIAGVAALLLATGAARAAEDTRKWIWRCSFPHTPSEEQEAEAEDAVNGGRMLHTATAITQEPCHCHGVRNCLILPT